MKSKEGEFLQFQKMISPIRKKNFFLQEKSFLFLANQQNSFE